MRYIMKSGNLYREPERELLTKIKSAIVGPIKKIYKCEEELSLETDIRYFNVNKVHSGDVRNKKYILIDREGKEVAVANPGYAEGDDPEEVGWPICRVPKVDHADLKINGDLYLLTMHNNQNYSVRDMKGKEIVRIMHRGIAGGWIIEDEVDLTPGILSGIFIFCRYIEQENELLII